MATFQIASYFEIMCREVEDYDMMEELEWFLDEDPYTDSEILLAWSSETGTEIVFEAEHLCVPRSMDRFIRLVAHIDDEAAAFHFRMAFGYPLARSLAAASQFTTPENDRFLGRAAAQALPLIP